MNFKNMYKGKCYSNLRESQNRSHNAIYIPSLATHPSEYISKLY